MGRRSRHAEGGQGTGAPGKGGSRSPHSSGRDDVREPPAAARTVDRQTLGRHRHAGIAARAAAQSAQEAFGDRWWDEEDVPLPPLQSGQAYSDEYLGGSYPSAASSGRGESFYPSRPQAFVGTIKCIYPDKGYGFIDCRETFDEFQSDIFIHKRHLDGYQVEDVILFQVQVNAKGQPQAADVRPFRGPLGSDYGEWDGEGEAGPAEPLRHAGVVKFFSEDKGYGFIKCRDFECDVFVHIFEMKNFGVGQAVEFCVKYKRDRPQAYNLEPTDPSFHAGLGASPTQRGSEVAPGVFLPLANSDAKIVHHGVIKKLDENKGYGFVNCPELYAQYNADVFVPFQQMKGLSVGDAVAFAVQHDAKGRPQAIDVAPTSGRRARQGSSVAASFAFSADGGDAAEPGDDEEESSRCVGMIKSFSLEHGYGFITGKAVLEKFGREAFLHVKQIKAFQVGDKVSFAVRTKNGQPQAYGLREVTASLAWLSSGAGAEDGASSSGAAAGAAAGAASSAAAGPAVGAASGSGPVLDQEEYLGEVKSFNLNKGYGFIDCPTLFEKFGRDVFVHSSLLEGLHVGDAVRFRAQVKRGQPQAHGVARAEAAPAAAAPAGGASASGAGSADERPRQKDLDKKLLRACASARAESPALVAELLAQGADPNSRDVTGQTPIMISALNVRHSERKCKFLVEHRADLDAVCSGGLNAIQWARERINHKFAAFLAAAQRGEHVDCDLALEAPADEF